jgi:hypothetical protein
MPRNCLTAKYNDRPLRVREELQYKGDSKEIKARKQDKECLGQFFHEVHEVKAQVL